MARMMMVPGGQGRRRGWRPAKPALKHGTSTHLSYRIHRFYCRYPADRLQARLLRAAPRIKSSARWETLRFCPEGVGVRLADDGLRSSPETRHLGTSVIPRTQVLLPVPGRSPASKAPTGCAQNQSTRYRKSASAEGVGVRLADDGPRSSPETACRQAN